MRSLNTKKYFLLVVALVFTLSTSGLFSVVHAQQELPVGGDSFSNATELQFGFYESGADWINLEEAPTKYFYVEGVNPGELLKIEAFVKDTDFGQTLEASIYNENREKLASNRTLFQGEGFEVSWLASTKQESSKYYIKLFCEHEDASFTIDINTEERYDAGTKTDAGDEITGALEIEPGEYEGYLNCPGGQDRSDFYKLYLQKGETITTKYTPDGSAFSEIRIYNEMRETLDEQRSPNYGAIIETVFEPEESGNYFIEIYSDDCDSVEGPLAYSLSIEKGGEPEGPAEGGEPEGPTGEPAGPPEEGPEKEGGNLLTYAAILIGILIIIGIAVYFLRKSK